VGTIVLFLQVQEIIKLPHVELVAPTYDINTTVRLVLLKSVSYLYAGISKKKEDCLISVNTSNQLQSFYRLTS
jgi:F0F1-type ATP synthase membrane subunit a